MKVLDRWREGTHARVDLYHLFVAACVHDKVILWERVAGLQNLDIAIRTMNDGALATGSIEALLQRCVTIS